MVVDYQKELGSHRCRSLRMRDPRSDQDVSDPSLVRAVGLIAAEGLRLGCKRFAGKSTASELTSHCALSDSDPVSRIKDPRDLSSRARRQLEAKCGGLVCELGMRAHSSSV
jgi:hypothetical protein